MNYGFIDICESPIVGVLIDEKLKHYKEYKTDELPVGSIIRARVIKKLPWLECFEVQISEDETALLPYRHKIDEASNDQILVQIVKQKLGKKSARVTEKIKIKGKYLIVDPYTNGVNISRKIEDSDKRDMLLDSVVSKNPNYGIIIRTDAQYAELDLIERELRILEMRTEMILRELNFLPTPKIIYWQKPDYAAEIKPFVENLDHVVTNSTAVFEELNKDYFFKDKIIIKREYKSTEDRTVQFRLGNRVNRMIELKSGANIVIDELEALTVIDVNSNSYTSGSNKEDSAYKVNLSVIDEILNQIVVRGLGGIILIDFIRMNSSNSDNVKNMFISTSKEYNLRINNIGFTRSGLLEVVVNR